MEQPKQQIVPYLEALSQQQKQGSRLQFFMLSKTIPFLVRNGYYKQAVERSKKLLLDNKEHKTMCMHLQFELGNIYKNCLTEKENAIAAFTTFLEHYEHEALTPIAKDRESRVRNIEQLWWQHTEKVSSISSGARDSYQLWPIPKLSQSL